MSDDKERIKSDWTVEGAALRCLERALLALDRAILMTPEHGPAAAMESLADFLNDTDGIDDEVAAATPDDWLERWEVTPRAEVERLRGEVARQAEQIARRWPHYTSTYCIHGQHGDCRLSCKVCHSLCRCGCHEAVP